VLAPFQPLCSTTIILSTTLQLIFYHYTFLTTWLEPQDSGGTGVTAGGGQTRVRAVKRGNWSNTSSSGFITRLEAGPSGQTRVQVVKHGGKWSNTSKRGQKRGKVVKRRAKRSRTLFRGIRGTRFPVVKHRFTGPNTASSRLTRIKKRSNWVKVVKNGGKWSNEEPRGQTRTKWSNTGSSGLTRLRVV
jgi:hypothetical protein